MGSCTAGGAYVPAMCDESIIVREQGTIFLGGPPLVKAATGEVVDAEALGGADVHTAVSGVADHFAENDATRCRSRATSSRTSTAARRCRWRCSRRANRCYAAEELYGIVPKDTRRPSTSARSSRASSTAPSSRSSRRATARPWSCGFAHIHGYPVGIVANNGILFAESALKGAHFIELCNQRDIPLVFLQNITGFMVGRKYENAGIAKDGAKMVTAVACSHVPKFTVVIGGSFGAGNYAMCGRAYGGRFLWMWPNARISVMGGEQAASVLATVKRDGIEAAGKVVDAGGRRSVQGADPRAVRAQGNPYYATARLWDDGIIDPADTRRVLGLALSAALNAPIEKARFGVFRM